MGEKYSLDSIIQAEVQKAIGAMKPAQPAGIFDGITMKDITAFISELAKLKTQMAQLTPQDPTPGPSPQASNPQASPAPAQALNPNAVYNGVLQGIDMIVPVLGDVKLSELKAYMTENKDAVIALIGSSLK